MLTWLITDQRVSAHHWCTQIQSLEPKFSTISMSETKQQWRSKQLSHWHFLKPYPPGCKLGKCHFNQRKNGFTATDTRKNGRYPPWTNCSQKQSSAIHLGWILRLNTMWRTLWLLQNELAGHLEVLQPTKSRLRVFWCPLGWCWTGLRTVYEKDGKSAKCEPQH